MLLVGKVLKPQGIQGEIKILPFLDTAEEFAKLTKVIINDKEYPLLSMRVSNKFVYAKLKGIADRNTAEELRESEIFIPKKDAPKLPKGRYYIDALLGSTVWVGKEVLGTLINILQYGSADVYEVDTPQGRVAFPFLHSLIVEINEKEKKIVLNSQEFAKVAVHED